MPYALNMGTNGVFAAEPVSNIIGGSICFITMLCTILPELKQMEMIDNNDFSPCIRQTLIV